MFTIAAVPLNVMVQIGTLWYAILRVFIVKVAHTNDPHHTISRYPSVVRSYQNGMVRLWWSYWRHPIHSVEWGIEKLHYLRHAMLCRDGCHDVMLGNWAKPHLPSEDT